MTPSVAICIPSGRTWEAEMALSLVSLVKETDLELHVLWQMGSQISFQRNELVRHALEDKGVDYLFWWDSDIVMPSTALIELLGHRTAIVGAAYCKKLPPYELVGKIERMEGRMKPATYLPGGCMLVDAGVYRDIGWPYYFEKTMPATLTWKQGYIQSEDFSFCEKALAKGWRIWCDIDLSQRVSHLGQQAVKMQLKEGHPDRVENSNV